jgi:hypothetical protein
VNETPNLNSTHFYLWGHLKSLVCSSAVEVAETVRNRTVPGFQIIRNMPGIWDRLRKAMRRRAEACIHTGGGYGTWNTWSKVI